jgi:hypothetical protein
VNQLVYVEALSTIFALFFGSAVTPDGALDLHVSFAPCHWDGLRNPTELA